MAPGAGFEPAWAHRPTGLAGLRPTRLGDPGSFLQIIRFGADLRFGEEEFFYGLKGFDAFYFLRELG